VQKAANKSSETVGDDSRAMDCNNQVTKYLVIKKNKSLCPIAAISHSCVFLY